MWNVIWQFFAFVGAIASIAGLAIWIAQFILRRRWAKQPTWDDSLRVAEKLLNMIEAGTWKPDVVVGLGRSGGIWGSWLAGNLGSLPMALIDIEYEPTERERRVEFYGAEQVLSYMAERFKGQPRVLVVEGAASTGTTLREFFRRFDSQLSKWDMKTAVLYSNPAADFAIDFVGSADLEPWPERFPWHQRAGYKPHLRNVFAHARLTAMPVAST